jgi:preprotein translocase subunit SecE
VAAFFHELLRVGIYKRSQGRIVRQVTFAALAITLALGMWRLSEAMVAKDPIYRYAIPSAMLAVCVWMSYRLVNVPAFADFLIAVEAEINKVSWPTRSEAFRASMVVLIVMFFLAFTLFACDFFWRMLLQRILHVL